ncbi:hypothetical protein TVAG_174710 [Trichomonas vaginalis G3]|uniref:BAR domain-containing protein n=1 Tax=Trichomonas vaginalis (strain ATCC PRA-98 / G3) TaxID=412133 RepID=A2EK17_TRIV3|nr:arfaptin homology (AH) domain/bar domain domain-containing protein [Trichomonas vaginalis G3]EAY07001.1 hypothetical protein TVAG_174710 [Trichomonas vaginalis G3]KAI5488819.1 arfaptin homology (AH) domain/bar domain domain-containing protein [Trichomonas vaginalis G3]|eukprot:XP_001319224.1 hypothetical protein [Trichomonas vaginalis G3]
MQKRWEKIKQSVSLGISAVKEIAGFSTVQEDKAYLDLIEQITEATAVLTEIEKDIDSYAQSVSAFTNAQYSLSGHIFALFKQGEQNYETAESAHRGQEAVYANGKNFSGHYIETYLKLPIKKLQEELTKINEMSNERKKDHILLVDSQNDLEKAKAKGKIKDIVEYQEVVATRQAKFAKIDDQFRQAARDYLTAAPEKYSNIFNMFQSYVAEFFDEGRKQAIDNVPTFKYDEIKTTRPTLTIAPAEPPKEEEQPKQEITNE